MPGVASGAPVPAHSQRWAWGLVLAGLLLMTASWAMRAQLPLLQRVDGWWLDTQLQLRGPLPVGTEHPIALVAIDDASLRELQQASVTRADLARLIDRLREAGARAVAVDMLLLEPGPPAHDAALAESLRAARAAGLTVLLPTKLSSPALPLK